MRPKEQKYAMERVEEIALQKFSAIRDALPIIMAKRLTYEQALRLIRSGKIKLKIKKDKKLYGYDDFSDVFDLKGHHDYQGEDSYDEKLYKKKTEPIRKERQRIKDQIMLGDTTKALRLIEDFAKK